MVTHMLLNTVKVPEILCVAQPVELRVHYIDLSSNLTKSELIDLAKSAKVLEK